MQKQRQSREQDLACAEEDLRVLVNNNLSQQHALAAMTANCLRVFVTTSIASRSREMIASLFLVFVRPHGVLSSLNPPSTRQMLPNWDNSQGEPWRDQGL